MAEAPAPAPSAEDELATKILTTKAQLEALQALLESKAAEKLALEAELAGLQ